ncbi:MAG: twin-arginine translocation signal domain-containing protein [Mesorhizobium sp.]|nr:MAG: twin-arginine translocation signal domain-containing protein [Mesorhizobium sp.]
MQSISRRQFLASTAAAGAASVVLPLINSRAAQAAAFNQALGGDACGPEPAHRDRRHDAGLFLDAQRQDMGRPSADPGAEGRAHRTHAA